MYQREFEPVGLELIMVFHEAIKVFCLPFGKWALCIFVREGGGRVLSRRHINLTFI
jgi:hypothetical protein